MDEHTLAAAVRLIELAIAVGPDIVAAVKVALLHKYGETDYAAIEALWLDNVRRSAADMQA